MNNVFVNQQDDRRRLPVVLLSGFLGSGKTTLVNAMLRDPAMADTAVAVNEFGEIPLDQHLIEQGGDKAFVMANGCLCCALVGDLDSAIMRIFTRREKGELPRFKRLIIEPSGLADPAPIAQAILRNPVMSKALRLEAIITTADATLVDGQLTRHEETRKQLSLADRLVITKTDMVDQLTIDHLEGALMRLNPIARILRARHGAVDLNQLLPLGFLDPSGARKSRRVNVGLVAELVKAESDPRHAASTVAISLIGHSPLKWKSFEAWLRDIRIDHARHILRIKGLMHIAGTPAPVVIQGVEHVMSAPVALHRWPDRDHRSRLVIIVRDLPREVIEKNWSKALPSLIASNQML